MKQFEIETFLEVVRRSLPRGWRPVLRLGQNDRLAPLQWLVGTAILIGFAFAGLEYVATYAGLLIRGGGGEHANFIAEFGYYGTYGPRIRVNDGVLLFLAIWTTIATLLIAGIIGIWYRSRAGTLQANAHLLRRVAISAAAGLPITISPFLLAAVAWQVLNCAVPNNYSYIPYVVYFTWPFGGGDLVSVLAAGVFMFGVIGMIHIFIIHRRALREMCNALEPIQVQIVAAEEA